MITAEGTAIAWNHCVGPSGLAPEQQDLQRTKIVDRLVQREMK